MLNPYIYVLGVIINVTHTPFKLMLAITALPC